MKSCHVSRRGIGIALNNFIHFYSQKFLSQHECGTVEEHIIGPTILQLRFHFLPLINPKEQANSLYLSSLLPVIV